MTDVQKHLLKLLKEIDEISTNSEGKITYFLADHLAWMAHHNKGFAGKGYQAPIMMTQSSFDAFQEVVAQNFETSRSFERLNYLHYRYVDNESLMFDIGRKLPWSQYGVAIDIKILWEVGPRDGFLYRLPTGKNAQFPLQLFSAQKRHPFEDTDLPQVEDIYFYLSALCGCDWASSEWPYAIRTESHKSYYDPQIPWESFMERSKVIQLIESDYGRIGVERDEYGHKREERQTAINKAAQYRRLIDLTGYHFDYWELFYPRKQEILKLEAENDFEALAKMLDSYLKQLEECWEHGESLVFDRDIFKAIEPLLKKRFGAEFLEEFKESLLEEYNQNLDEYLHEQKTSHLLLERAISFSSQEPFVCKITSLKWEHDDLIFAGEMSGNQLRDDLKLFIESDVCATSILSVPIDFRERSASSGRFSCRVNMEEIVNACLENGLVTEGGVHALRFVIRSKEGDFRLIFGNRRSGGLFDTFVASAYQNEHAILVPEETSWGSPSGSFMLWLFNPKGTSIHSSVCGRPVAREQRQPFSNLLTRALSDFDFVAAKSLITDENHLDSLSFSYDSKRIQVSWKYSEESSIEAPATHLLRLKMDSFVKREKCYFLQGTLTVPTSGDISSDLSAAILLHSESSSKKLLKVNVELQQKFLPKNGVQIFDWHAFIDKPSISEQLLSRSDETADRYLYFQLRIADFACLLPLKSNKDGENIYIPSRVGKNRLLCRMWRISCTVRSFFGRTLRKARRKTRSLLIRRKGQ